MEDFQKVPETASDVDQVLVQLRKAEELRQQLLLREQALEDAWQQLQQQEASQMPMSREQQECLRGEQFQIVVLLESLRQDMARLEYSLQELSRLVQPISAPSRSATRARIDPVARRPTTSRANRRAR
ncbi:hypothetical protein AAW14_24830 [Streptomyces hygroscopicus]|uniref:hypothetical protein n=1 Tax=Streptomyces hygroscopicus TaxID=1912 RepID=UPI00223EACC6|nr:hypothetical protein [Streptomyces hygroscopicus]MCW7945148.1 hypothetical protein [Streptomyces hygroscopicus]